MQDQYGTDLPYKGATDEFDHGPGCPQLDCNSVIGRGSCQHCRDGSDLFLAIATVILTGTPGTPVPQRECSRDRTSAAESDVHEWFSHCPDVLI